MDAVAHWDELRTFFNGNVRCVFASAGQNGAPHATPIGSFFLTEPGRGFYLEKLPATMPQDFKHNPAVCIYGSGMTNMGFLWALIKGEFARAPAYRLYGRAGERRESTAEELAAFARRTRLFRGFKGARMLWSGMRYARDVFIESADGLNLGALTYKGS